MAVAEDAVSVTEGEAEEAGAKHGRKNGGGGELEELHFEIARNF